MFTVIALTYVALLLILYFGQRWLVYPATRFTGPARFDAGFPAEVVLFDSKDGVRISGLWSEPAAPDRPVVLIFHGNGGSIRGWRFLLEGYQRRGFGGLLMDLRGYGWSGGSPSEEGWRQDAEAALDYLVARGIAPKRIVIHGISIGTGPAMWLAARRDHAVLILQSPFTSLARVAQRTFFFVPCRLILRDRYDNLAEAPEITGPVLIIHGTADGIVAPSHSERLAAAFPDPVQRVTAPGYGHNDLSFWDDYWPTITSFVDGLSR